VVSSGRVAVLALVLACGVGVGGGCASRQGAAEDGEGGVVGVGGDEPVNAGLARLMGREGVEASVLPDGPPTEMTDEQIAALVQRSALDLERVFAQEAERRAAAAARAEARAAGTQPGAAMAQDPVGATPDAPSASGGPASGLASLMSDTGGGGNAAAPVATRAGDAGVSTDVMAQTPTATDAASATNGQGTAGGASGGAVSAALAGMSEEDRVFVEAASRIAALMRPSGAGADAGGANGANGAGGGGMHEALALAAIESVRPGTLAGLDDPSGVLARGLPPGQYEALRAARDRVAANPVAAGGAARDALATLAPSVRMVNVALCTRVMGFGRYDAYPTYDFVAGRPIRAIVYAEIEGFTPRGAKAGDPVQRGVPLDEQRTVDLSQSLTLFHDVGTMQAWHRPFQRVIETSRAVRRDFYVIQQIELPRQLPIGEYRLKVTIRDNVTNAEYEQFIPLRIVAPGPVAPGVTGATAGAALGVGG
jgi:hypothetical protein